MAYTFTFNGGAVKPNINSNIKFFLFFVVGGEEIPLYRALTEGLVSRSSDQHDFDIPNSFKTSLNVGKLFTSHAQFGHAKQYYSFYFKFKEPENNPKVTIKGFGNWPAYYFMSWVSFLRRNEIIAVLSEDSNSLKFLKHQRTLPVATLRELINVDRSDMLKGQRRIRIGNN
jgi:hypothetical protein